MYTMGNKSYILPFFVLIFSLSWQGLQVLSDCWLTQWNWKVENKNFNENQNTKRERYHAILY